MTKNSFLAEVTYNLICHGHHIPIIKDISCKNISGNVIQKYKITVLQEIHETNKYGFPAWDANNQTILWMALKIQGNAAKFIMNNHNRNKSVTNIITELNLHSTELRYKVKKVQLMHYMLTQKTFLSTC